LLSGFIGQKPGTRGGYNVRTRYRFSQNVTLTEQQNYCSLLTLTICAASKTECSIQIKNVFCNVANEKLGRREQTQGSRKIN